MGPEALAGIESASPINHGWLMDVLNWLTTIALAVFIWISQKRQVTRDQIKQLDENVQLEIRDIHKRVSNETRKLDNRITRLEEWRQTVPGTVDVEKLYTQLEVVKGDVKEINSGLKSISGSVGGVQRSIGLINEHLLAQDKQLSRTVKGEGDDG